jgi:type I restriction enzyme, S subunit
VGRYRDCLLMSKETYKRIVPKLRFAQFADDEEWAIKFLSDIAFNFDNRRIPITSSERKKGPIPYYGASGIIDFVQGFIFDDDLLCISEDGANLIDRNYPIAFSITGKTWVNNHAHVLKFENKYTQVIVEKYLNEITLEDFLTGMAQPKLNRTKLDIIPIPLPKPPEQQKIAACLSSLDELITAESQKRDALKTHKKGLMQQLFPAEGETVPKRRFAEFRDNGEWVEKMIGEISKVTTGGKDTQNKVDDGLYPFFVRSQTVERINSYSFDGEAILTSGDGVGVGKNFHYINGKFDFHQRVYCIYDFSEKAYGHFLYLYFSQHFYKRVNAMSAKNSVDSVRMSMITEMPIKLPSYKEQEKVADCLSYLNELVTAQLEKIEALKLHKKGLMQQLFPQMFESTSDQKAPT